MLKGGLTRKLIEFANALVAHIRGGLGHVTVVANLIMAGMSGSEVADAAATGAILIPSMKEKGYPPGFAAGITAAAAGDEYADVFDASGEFVFANDRPGAADLSGDVL